MTSTSMYREHILDLYRNPSNFGKLENPTNYYKEFNPLCGDEVEIQLIIKNNVIENVKFIGKGCAISIASASLVTDKIKGKSIDDINKFSKDDVLKMLNIPISPGRIKCATLSLEALRKAII